MPDYLLIQFHPNGGWSFFTVEKHKKCNVVYSRYKFMTSRDVMNWCDREYPGIPYSFF